MDNTPTTGPPQPANEAKPGDTIAPAQAPMNMVASAEASLPTPSDQQLAPDAPVSSFQNVPDPAPSPADSTYAPQSTVQVQPAATPSAQSLSWIATEFIAHDKSIGWYGILTAVVIVVSILVYVLTKDKISTSVVIVAGLAFGVYAARKPRQRGYALDDQGVTVGDKYFPYELFRSFSVMSEGPIPSVSFFPLKRFGQLTTIYYDPANEDAIIELLADRLPIEDRGHDAIDRFMNRIRF